MLFLEIIDYFSDGIHGPLSSMMLMFEMLGTSSGLIRVLYNQIPVGLDM